MNEKTVLIVGVLGAGVLVLFLLSKKQQQNLAAQQLALSGQYANTTAGQVGGILSSVGSFFNSGALQSLKDAFLDTGGNNEPGLVPSSNAPSGSNDPGLNSPSVWGANYGPQQNDADIVQSSKDYASLGLDD